MRIECNGEDVIDLLDNWIVRVHKKDGTMASVWFYKAMSSGSHLGGHQGDTKAYIKWEDIEYLEIA